MHLNDKLRANVDRLLAAGSEPVTGIPARLPRFRVCFEIVTPESAADGEAAERGVVGDFESLREALEAWNGYGCHVECDSAPASVANPPRWFTAYGVNDGTREYYETGAEESRSLHFLRPVSPHSAVRVARLVGAYGVK